MASPLRLAFLASGASVSLWDRDKELLRLAVDQLRGAGSVSIESVDVSNSESEVTATENTIVKHGKIEILVASAGIAGPNYKTWEYPSTRGSKSSTLISQAYFFAVGR